MLYIIIINVSLCAADSLMIIVLSLTAGQKWHVNPVEILFIEISMETVLWKCPTQILVQILSPFQNQLLSILMSYFF